MMMPKDRSNMAWLTDNGSYKIVALVVATVLWVTMQGRRDSVVSKELELQLILSPGTAVSNPVPPSVKVEVSGPRVAREKFRERTMPFVVDLSSLRTGRQIVHLTKDGLNLPLGAKVLSIHPAEFLAVIVETNVKK